MGLLFVSNALSLLQNQMIILLKYNLWSEINVVQAIFALCIHALETIMEALLWRAEIDEKRSKKDK